MAESSTEAMLSWRKFFLYLMYFVSILFSGELSYFGPFQRHAHEQTYLDMHRMLACVYLKNKATKRGRYYSILEVR